MTPVAALAYVPAATMMIQSDLLGSLEIAADELIEFPAGIFGFPECQRFVLVSTERDGLYWLQSADHSALAFLVVDPFLHFEGYEVDLGAAERKELDVADEGDVVVLSIVTLPQRRTEQPTANLQGPVAVNLRARIGLQLAIAESRWGMRCPVDLARVSA
jgi:flagellar assembly factor FliW